MADKVLIIDADKAAMSAVATLLSRHGFEAIIAGSAEEGLRKAYHHQPDLVLLEVLLPNMDAWETCRRLRDLADIPIVFLSARQGKKDIIRGLEVGADDYIGRPYDDDILVARLKARLRPLRRLPRARLSEELIFSQGDFRIDFMHREVWLDDRSVHLTPKEFNLLAVLTRNAGHIVRREELVTTAWGAEYSNAVDSLKLYIHYLRKKLETNPQQPKYILTARGIGYRFVRD